LQAQRIEDSEGRLIHLDGCLLYKPSLKRAALRVSAFDHDIRFVPGTWAVESLEYLITFSDDTKINIKGVPLTRAWAYKGTGYDRGFRDGLGLGAQRGNPPPEFDIYDLSHPEDVRDMQGSLVGSGHREQPMRLTVDGEPCLGHFPVMVFDTLPGMSV
jgi:hypothetical protein